MRLRDRALAWRTLLSPALDVYDETRTRKRHGTVKRNEREEKKEAYAVTLVLISDVPVFAHGKLIYHRLRVVAVLANVADIVFRPLRRQFFTEYSVLFADMDTLSIQAEMQRRWML